MRLLDKNPTMWSLEMKFRFSRSLQITLTACLLLLGACGKKNSTGTGISGTSPFYSGNPALGGGSGYIDQYNKVKASISCLPGRSRLLNDVSFYISGPSGSGSTIGGNWQSGFITNGTVTNLYVGVSAYRDLMFVTKVTNGGTVVGYNVTLSFCEVPNAIPNYPALISNDRPLVNFQAPNGIVLGSTVSCGYGVVWGAINTIITSNPSTTNPYTMAFPVYTSFASPQCN